MILWRDGALSGCCVYIVQVPAECYCKTYESLMNSELTLPELTIVQSPQCILLLYITTVAVVALVALVAMAINRFS